MVFVYIPLHVDVSDILRRNVVVFLSLLKVDLSYDRMSKPIKTPRSTRQNDMRAYQSRDLEAKRARYRLIRVIGSGQYATVWRASDLQAHNRSCVVKDIHMLRYKCKLDRAIQYVMAEIDIMKRIDHPNIVRIYDHYMGVVNGEPHVYVVMEYCDGGTLKAWLRSQTQHTSTITRYKLQFGKAPVKDKPLPPNTHPMVRPSWEQTCRHIVRQIISGYRALHTQKIMHRDLKPENILFTYRLDGDDGEQNKRHARSGLRTPIVKLADFGFSKVLTEEGTGAPAALNLAHTFCGTPYYMAPELFEHAGYTDKADVWSLGVMIYEMMENKRPFDTGLRTLSQMRDATKTLTLHFPRKHTPVVWCDFVSALLTVDVAKRLDWNSIFTHPMFGCPPTDTNLQSGSVEGMIQSCPIYIRPNRRGGKPRKRTQSHWRDIVYDVQGSTAFSLPNEVTAVPRQTLSSSSPLVHSSSGGTFNSPKSAPSEQPSRLVRVDNYFALILSKSSNEQSTSSMSSSSLMGSPRLQFNLSQDS